MKENIYTIIKFVFFLSIGILIFWWVYKDQNVGGIVDALKEANYFWIGVSLFLSILSHFSRAVRWQLLIESLGHKVRIINVFFAVLVMYISNMAIPRSGEITRCSIIKKYEKVSLSKLLGTVVIERTFDFIMLFILLIVVLLTQYNVVLEFIHNNPGVEQKVSSILQIKYLIVFLIIIAITLASAYFFRKKFKKSLIYIKISELAKNFISGIDTVRKMDKKWSFIFHSVFIWVMYFSMIYVTFWSFKFTEHLSLLSGLTVFVMASFGMVAPSPGGIGTWHFMTIETLAIYGIAKIPDANAFALAAHGAMNLFLLIVGVIALILLPVVNNKSTKVVETKQVF
ncbi:MAG: flippase-like domain-containing protein [Bacteroidales bacterium]|nr:flippase-like domain-containing protein [Bacteroidales bacterium]MBN2758117.1 flippase-like domain-containing protein [Bacteroidales bacterium]